MKNFLTKARILIALRVILVLAFGIAGAAKLAGAAPMVAVFESIGAGQWFRYVTGGVELVGALLLLRQSSTFIGGLLLTCTMACATATHILIIGGSALPALLLGILSLTAAYVVRSLKGTVA